MKKEITVIAIIFLFVATPVMAQSDTNNDKDNNDSAIYTQTIHFKITDNKPIPTREQNITPTCDLSANWKNHGAFVSCVAHLHHYDTDNDVNDSAHSDIDKFHPTEIQTPTISVTVDPTVTPTVTISPTAIPTPTASISPTPEISDMDIYHAPKSNLENNFVTTLGRILFFISHLL